MAIPVDPGVVVAVAGPLGGHMQTCIIGLALGLALLALATCRKSLPLPGKLVPRGSFQHEDPANEDSIAERRRDFSRIINTKRDLWYFTGSSRDAGNVLPIELSSDEKNSSSAGDVAYEKLKIWLQGQLPRGTGPPVEELANRIIFFISVSPGFEFMMKHRVPPMSLPAKYVLMVSKSGQVRVAWYAFITDKPTPGATSSPFVVRLLSEDLAAARGARTHTEFEYVATTTRDKEINKVVSKHVPAITKGIESDAWDAYSHA